MAKKHYKKVDNKQGLAWNQTQYINDITYSFHWQELYELALSRVEWINLPEGIDSRFLEKTLLENGNAIIFQDKKLKDLFFGTKVVGSAPINVYDNPTKLRSVGNNGWNVNVPWKKGVVVWDSQSRLPILQYISLFANRLMDIDRTRDVNLNAQHTPYITTVPEEKYQEAVNAMRSIESHEPVIIGLPSFKDIDVKVLSTNTPYLGTELQYNKELIKNEFKTFLGIDNSGLNKKERMTQDEVDKNDSEIMLRRMNFLTPRRDALAILKKRFPEQFKDTQVVWKTDIITPNYNITHNLEKALEVGEGVDIGGLYRKHEQSE